MTTPNTGQQHPPGCYYVNVETGTIQRQCDPILALGLAALGFWGVGGPADGANAFPDFATASAFAQEVMKRGGATGAAGGQGGVAAVNPLGFLDWLQDIGHWLGILVSALTDLHTWISLGWALLGAILLWLGVWWWFRSTDTGQRLADTATSAGAAAVAA